MKNKTLEDEIKTYKSYRNGLFVGAAGFLILGGLPICIEKSHLSYICAGAGVFGAAGCTHVGYAITKLIREYNRRYT